MKKICGTKLKTLLFFSLFLALGIFSGARVVKATETLMFENSIGGNANSGFTDGGNDGSYKFTTGATTTNITKIKLTTTNDSPTGCNAYVKIRKVSGCATPLATSSLVAISATNTNYDFTFSGGSIAVDPNTDYLLSYWSSCSVEFRTSLGYDWEWLYWWSACSTRLQYNGLYARIYWDPAFIPPPTILYTGLGTEQSDKEGNFYIPFYWNACQWYGNIDSVDVWAYFNGTTAGEPFTLVQSGLIGPQQCRGSGVYKTNQNYSTQLNASGTAILRLEMYTKDNQIIDVDTSSAFNYSLYTNPANYLYGSSYGFDNSFTQLVNTEVGTSTEVQVLYDFTGLSDWASSSICVYNVQSAVDTSYCFTPTSISGFGSVWLPHSPSNNFDLYFKWHANFPTSTDLWDNNVFHIIWQVSTIPGSIYSTQSVCQPPLFNTNNICNGDATSSPSLGWLACGIKSGIVYSGNFLFSPDCGSFNYLTTTYNKFKASFPVNIFFQFIDTFDQAINSAASSSVSQTLGVPFIRKTATSSEYYIIPLVSSTTYQNLIGSSNYNLIRTCEEYAYWILAAIGVYFIVKPKHSE